MTFPKLVRVETPDGVAGINPDRAVAVRRNGEGSEIVLSSGRVIICVDSAQTVASSLWRFLSEFGDSYVSEKMIEAVIPMGDENADIVMGSVGIFHLPLSSNAAIEAFASTKKYREGLPPSANQGDD